MVAASQDRAVQDTWGHEGQRERTELARAAAEPRAVPGWQHRDLTGHCPPELTAGQGKATSRHQDSGGTEGWWHRGDVRTPQPQAGWPQEPVRARFGADPGFTCRDHSGPERGPAVPLRQPHLLVQ